MLDEKSVLPLYYQLKEKLMEKIKAGDLKENDKVPSERELMEMYNVSRATARKALSELINEGIIVAKQGVGTFVTKPKILQDPTGDISFANQVRRQGLQPSLNIINSGIEQHPSNRLQNLLGSDSDIFGLFGVLCADDVPLILESDYILLDRVPNIFEKELERTVFFEYLKNECNIQFTHSTLEIEPIIITEFEANHLKTNSGKPALLIERVLYSNETAIVFQRRVILGERCKYTFTLGQNSYSGQDYPFSIQVKK
jgi:GntR family transcriptional regulator